MSDDQNRAIAKGRSRVAEPEHQLREREGPAESEALAQRPPRALISMRLLHRWAALVTFVFLFVMGVTGIFLSHGDQVGLQPLMIQLHAGLFLGAFGWLYCDLLGVAVVLLAATGIGMYVASYRKPGRQRGD